MKVKIDIAQIKRYFEDFSSIGMLNTYFNDGEFDKETNQQYLNYRTEFESIYNLCNEFGLQGYENDFFALSIVVGAENIERSKAAPLGEQYTRELYIIFRTIVKSNKTGINEKKLNLKLSLNSETIPVKSNIFLNQFKDLICNSVAESWNKTNWASLLPEEKLEIINKVNCYLNITSPKSGAPLKTIGKRKIVTAIKKYINGTIPKKFDSGRKLHLFIGKLTCIYGILPEPVSHQLEQRDEYYIKTIENLLPKN